MIHIGVRGNSEDVNNLVRLAQSAQSRFRFIPQEGAGPTQLWITDSPSPALFTMCRGQGLQVSTWQSEGICRYAGLRREAYLLVCSMLGLTQLRAMILNPLLIPEDFVHTGEGKCLFERQASKQDYALLLEHPRICEGCMEFFRCLGLEPEIEALQRVLHFITECNSGTGTEFRDSG